MERLKTSHVSISNGSRKKFQRQIYCKKWFSDRVFYVTISYADIGSPLKMFVPHASEIWKKIV